MTELGAKTPLSVDTSNHEGAKFIADMNKPIPPELAGRFSAVIDGGTLEHVFDFPQAALNVAKMLKVGGHSRSVIGPKTLPAMVSINSASNYDSACSRSRLALRWCR
jgi:hypothetical protein